MTAVLNRCLIVLPIFKKGDESQIENYRPVSILPTFSIVFELSMTRRFVKCMEKVYFDSNEYGSLRDGGF